MGFFDTIFGGKQKASGVPASIRDTLFGDMPLDQWPKKGGLAELAPWDEFAKAQQLIGANKTVEAAECWKRIIARPGLEARHYIQAWNFLRQYGVEPAAAEAKNLYGVVFEVPIHGGLDLLAAYSDHSARYYNYQSSGVVWDHPDDSLDKPIDDLLSAAKGVVNKIGPWEGDRPPAPPAGQVRMSFLTPSGLHFGQGPFEALQRDPIAGQTVQLATQLMVALVDKGLAAGKS